MGYSITIGNAVPEGLDPDDDRLEISYTVEGAKHDNAPAYGEPTDFTNERWPSYTVWSDFAKEVGLYDFFFDKSEGLMRSHPGCFRLSEIHLKAVQFAIEKRKMQTKGKPAGFLDYSSGCEVDNGNDPQLARLTWLEYWINWALKNCAMPAIENT